jgi:hypothetical protein
MKMTVFSFVVKILGQMHPVKFLTKRILFHKFSRKLTAVLVLVQERHRYHKMFETVEIQDAHNLPLQYYTNLIIFKLTMLFSNIHYEIG